MPISKTYILSVLTISTLFSCIVSADDNVKRTRSGLCHDNTSHSFNAIKHYVGYDSLSSCLSLRFCKSPIK